MTGAAGRDAIRLGALALGVVLFFGTLYYINFQTAVGTVQRLGVALPLALLFSGLWHLVRTWAWAWCFPRPLPVSFLQLTRVRLSAEAFSYLTLRGIAGEPLKVVLLGDRVDARAATAAVALERLAYIIGTTVIVGIGSVAAMIGLPLTRPWFRVFRAFALSALVITALSAIVIAGRGTYLQSLLRRVDTWLDTSLAEGRISAFLTAVERQMLDLLRGNPRRLIVLLAATVVSYVLMALEAWVILYGSGAPVTPNGALAVETFSRVASFASSFIPANLGALEASSLAAVAAVGGAGGAALALARRLRGLFWAAVGLAIYPRKSRPFIQRPRENDPSGAPRTTTPTLLYLPGDPRVRVSPWARIAALPIVERVLRSAARAGFRVIVWAPDDSPCGGAHLPRLASLAHGIDTDIAIARTTGEWRAFVQAFAATEPVTVIGAGIVVSPALLASALRVVPEAGVVRHVPAGPEWPASGVVRVVAADSIDSARLIRALGNARRRASRLPSGADVSNGLAHLALRIFTPEDLPAAERTIRRASYKDTDNKLARFNRRISLPISVALMRTPLTANQLSIVLVGVGFYAAWLFSLGFYWSGVLGAFLSLAASVLDGCDGEIARLKYQESPLGCWIETFGDYSYYVAIFIGLTIGAVRETRLELFYWIGGLMLAGTLVSLALLIYLRSRITAGQPEKLHAIARARFNAEPTLWSTLIWRVSFIATRSAMPYGIMLLALLDQVPAIVVIVAVSANIYWISLVVKLRHLLGAEEAQAVST
jgi:phosphatidylglycerophosphate synthase